MNTVLRLRRYARGGGLLFLVLIITGVTWSVLRVPPMAVSIGVHRYQRQGDEVFVSLMLTNTGAVAVAVPLQYGCYVRRLGSFTNYSVKTQYTMFLKPGDRVILSDAPCLLRLPADTSNWKVSVRIRKQSGRERFVDAVRRSGLVSPRILSKLGGGPRKDADYEWTQCESGWLEVPGRPVEGATISHGDWENEPRGPALVEEPWVTLLA